jgi:hypothetical protein
MLLRVQHRSSRMCSEVRVQNQDKRFRRGQTN